jgi:hypothetical protein
MANSFPENDSAGNAAAALAAANRNSRRFMANLDAVSR